MAGKPLAQGLRCAVWSIKGDLDFFAKTENSNITIPIRCVACVQQTEAQIAQCYTTSFPLTLLG